MTRLPGMERDEVFEVMRVKAVEMLEVAGHGLRQRRGLDERGVDVRGTFTLRRPYWDVR